MTEDYMAPVDSHLIPIVIPNELETSTPINAQRHGRDAADLLIEPVNLNNGLKKSAPGHTVKETQTVFNESLLSYKGNDIPRDAGAEPNSSYYSMDNDACKKPTRVDTRTHKVSFSPTKEVVSYGQAPNHEFQVDFMHVDRPSKETKHHGAKATQSLFWARIAVDPRVPYVLLLYLQLFFNVVIVLVVLYLLYTVLRTVRQDVRHKIEMYTSDALQEISLCSRQYYRNRCSNDARAPALEDTCMTLEKCMNRDPQQIGKSKITAETFADILNGFMDPVSWKLAVLFTGLIVGGVVVINVAFGTYRSRSGMEEYTKTIDTIRQKEDTSRDNRPYYTNEQLAAATTPPNPPLPQDAVCEVDESTLSFSLPLSRRSAKQSF